MNTSATKSAISQEERKIVWPECLGFTAFVAAVRANFRDYGFSVSQSIAVGADRQFTVINNHHGRYRYVLVLSGRLGTVILKELNGYPEREIFIGDLFKDNVAEILWPNTDPEILHPEGVGMIR